MTIISTTTATTTTTIATKDKGIKKITGIVQGKIELNQNSLFF